VAWEVDISGLDPHLSFGMQAWLVVGNLFNSLVTIDPELNVVPDLAESWEVLENSKVYVFHLRKGVTFHDGIDRPVIAKTVLLGQAQPLWSIVPPGSRGQIDFGEQCPYDPEKARILLKEAGYDFQRYEVQNMMLTSVSSSGHLQAARSDVKGYENLHGYKLRFETTWLEK
jgi:ABC-type transport system substrate-binding protein